jgi:ADP-ribosylarginine hydrolase
MSNLNEKIKASLFLLSYFDTLGFNNTSWEFNFGKAPIGQIESAYLYLEIIHEYFALGGYTNIDISDWNASDDTIMMLATGFACKNGGGEKNYINEYLHILEKLKDDKRGSGINTINILEKIKRLQSIDKLDYKESAGGNGAAMRTSVIGLIYYKEKDIDKLIENSIVASRVTHNYSLGFLGGLVTALFTSYAVRDIPPWDWVDMLLNLYNDGKIDNYMKKTNIYKEYLKDKDIFFDKWEQYKEQKLSNFKKIDQLNLHKFIGRLDFLDEYNSYTFRDNKKNYARYGASGISCLIVAYDSLLMSYGGNKRPLDSNFKNLKVSLDSLIFFSCLHFGDSDTTGAVAGAWYGALYGFKNFDNKKLDQLEFKNKLENLTKLLT